MSVSMLPHKAERFDAGTNDEYHAGEGLSNSQLSDFADSPAKYHAIHVAKTLPKPESTADQKIGTLLHELVLEGEFKSAVAIPRDVLNKDGHRKGSAWTQWAADHEGQVFLTDSERSDLLEMADAIEAHPAARELLMQEGESEVPLRMQCPITGLLLRCKLDRLSPGRFIADLKTTKDPSPRGFASSVATFGYHRQQAFYGRIAASYSGANLPFFFVAIGKTKPYRVEVYRLQDDFAASGEAECETLLRQLAKCHETGNWQYPHFGSVLELPKPRYMNYQSEWEASE
jgi:hypothetical protein